MSFVDPKSAEKIRQILASLEQEPCTKDHSDKTISSFFEAESTSLSSSTKVEFAS
jgi:hypothetical protein